MVVKEYEYTGNAAINPNRKSTERDKKKYEELKKSKKNRNRRIIEEKNKKKKAVLQIACLIFILGITLVTRDTKVYDIQNSIGDLNSKINEIEEENEAIKVDILKYSSISNIRSNAEENLGMTIATKENSVEIDLSKNYFESLNNEDEKNAQDNKSIFSKLMDALNF
ncbi:MAG: cell division protein FtsL [Clostridiales bacterium]|nr:cell division protein FtsL [Clostridiales bacterium]